MICVEKKKLVFFLSLICFEKKLVFSFFLTGVNLRLTQNPHLGNSIMRVKIQDLTDVIEQQQQFVDALRRGEKNTAPKTINITAKKVLDVIRATTNHMIYSEFNSCLLCP